MMTGQRRSLDFGELDKFTPRPKPAAPAAVERKAVDQLPRSRAGNALTTPR